MLPNKAKSFLKYKYFRFKVAMKIRANHIPQPLFFCAHMQLHQLMRPTKMIAKQKIRQKIHTYIYVFTSQLNRSCQEYICSAKPKTNKILIEKNNLFKIIWQGKEVDFVAPYQEETKLLAFGYCWKGKKKIIYIYCIKYDTMWLVAQHNLYLFLYMYIYTSPHTMSVRERGRK